MQATRRAMIGAAVALPALATAAAVAAPAPDSLLALCAEHRRLNALYRALDRNPNSTDADYDRLSDQMTPIANRAIGLPARTLEEVRAKAGLIADIYDCEAPQIFQGPTGALTMDCRIVLRLLRDLGVC